MARVQVSWAFLRIAAPNLRSVNLPGACPPAGFGFWCAGRSAHCALTLPKAGVYFRISKPRASLPFVRQVFPYIV